MVTFDKKNGHIFKILKILKFEIWKKKDLSGKFFMFFFQFFLISKKKIRIWFGGGIASM